MVVNESTRDAASAAIDLPGARAVLCYVVLCIVYLWVSSGSSSVPVACCALCNASRLGPVGIMDPFVLLSPVLHLPFVKSGA